MILFVPRVEKNDVKENRRPWNDDGMMEWCVGQWQHSIATQTMTAAVATMGPSTEKRKQKQTNERNWPFFSSCSFRCEQSSFMRHLMLECNLYYKIYTTQYTYLEWTSDAGLAYMDDVRFCARLLRHWLPMYVWLMHVLIFCVFLNGIESMLWQLGPVSGRMPCRTSVIYFASHRIYSTQFLRISSPGQNSLCAFLMWTCCISILRSMARFHFYCGLP